MFSAAIWAEWTPVAKSVDGSSTNYVDFERIRKANGLVYYWMILDRLEPSSGGDLSYKSYWKVDCKTMRQMGLSFSRYKLPMGEGPVAGTFNPPEEWQYVPPDSVREITLLAVCAH